MDKNIIHRRFLSPSSDLLNNPPRKLVHAESNISSLPPTSLTLTWRSCYINISKLKQLNCVPFLRASNNNHFFHSNVCKNVFFTKHHFLRPSKFLLLEQIISHSDSYYILYSKIKSETSIRRLFDTSTVKGVTLLHYNGFSRCSLSKWVWFPSEESASISGSSNSSGLNENWKSGSSGKHASCFLLGWIVIFMSSTYWCDFAL